VQKIFTVHNDTNVKPFCLHSIVVLDEVDQLTEKVTTALLDWRIILIGVGNTFTITKATGARKMQCSV